MLALSACGPAAEAPKALGEAEQPTASATAGKQFGTRSDGLGSDLGTPVATGSTCGATNQATPSCAYSSAPDQTYNWSAPYSGTFTFSTSGSSYDTVLHLYNAATGAPLGCNDDSGNTLQSSVTLALSGGQSLRIVVDGFSNACGNYSLNITGASAPAKYAMTWALLGTAAPGNGHAYALVGSDGVTNAYSGDTFTNQARPVLCINKNGAANPGSGVIGPPTQTPGGAWRRTWAGATLALTSPVVGTSLSSRSVADSLCASTFGAGYRMAEFHDGDPGYWCGWDFWGDALSANLAPFVNTRFWVSINDQNANPW